MNASQVAKVCHDVNKAFCESIGDSSQVPWDETSGQIKRSAVDSVRYRLDNPNAKPADSHESWLAFKEADGWVYGEVKCEENKTHPCMRPYEELPQEQRSKDFLFKATVKSLEPYIY